MVTKEAAQALMEQFDAMTYEQVCEYLESTTFAIRALHLEDAVEHHHKFLIAAAVRHKCRAQMDELAEISKIVGLTMTGEITPADGERLNYLLNRHPDLMNHPVE